MPTSIREQILAAVATALTTAATGAGADFERNRVHETDPAMMPCWVMLDGGHEVLDGETGGITRALAVDVELYATGATGAAAGANLSEAAAVVTETLRPDEDGLLLGGLADDVREVELSDPEFGNDADTGFFAAARLRLLVIFDTEEFDPRTSA